MIKLLIKIDGGCLVSVEATEPVEYVLIDHDNLLEGGNIEISDYDGLVTEKDIEKEIEKVRKIYQK